MRLLAKNAANDPKCRARQNQHPGKTVARPRLGGRALPVNGTRVIPRSELTAALVDDLDDHQRWGNITVMRIGGSRDLVDFVELRDELGITAKLAPELAEETAPNPQPVAVGVGNPEAIERLELGTPEKEPVPSFQGETSVSSEPAKDEELTKLPFIDDESTADEDELGAADEIQDEEPVGEGEDPEESSVPAALDEIVDPEPEAAPEPKTNETFEVPDDIYDRLKKPRVVTNKELGEMLAVLGGTGTGKNKATLVDEIVEALLEDDLDPVKGNRVLEMLAAAESE